MKRISTVAAAVVLGTALFIVGCSHKGMEPEMKDHGTMKDKKMESTMMKDTKSTEMMDDTMAGEKMMKEEPMEGGMGDKMDKDKM